MKRFLMSTVLAIAVAMAVSAGTAQAGFVNGGFDTGDFTGWDVTGGSLAQVVTSTAKLEESGTWSPAGGSHFAFLQSGLGNGVYTIISQTFTASAGDKLKFKVFFDTGDYLPFNDNGFANLLDANTDAVVATLYYNDVANVGDYGSSADWESVNYTIAAGGNYKIQFGVTNAGPEGDNEFTSAIGVDEVVLESVPAPPAVILAGFGLASMCGLGRFARRKATVAVA